MKLELKHLAPYLPYGLELQILQHPFGIVPRKLELDCGHDFNYHLQEGNVKPILYPLSDFIKFEGLIDEMSEQQVERLSTYLKLELIPKGGYVSLLEYNTIIKMFEYHLDIFFLIPKGLAIDKNTLSK